MKISLNKQALRNFRFKDFHFPRTPFFLTKKDYMKVRKIFQHTHPTVQPSNGHYFSYIRNIAIVVYINKLVIYIIDRWTVGQRWIGWTRLDGIFDAVGQVGRFSLDRLDGLDSDQYKA